MFEFIKDKINSLSLGDAKLSFSNEKSAIGIDIGSSAIKIVQLRKEKGKAILETYGELALGPYAGLEVGQATNLPNEKIVEALKDLMREAHTTTLNAAVAIPFNSSLISLIELPKLSEKDLAQMVPLEARKYIPVPIGEVTLDWWQVPKVPKTYDPNEEQKPEVKTEAGVEKTEILFAAIHKDTITKYQDIIKQAQLSVSFFEIELFSTLRSVLRRDLSITMVVDVGASNTKVFIVERGVLRSSHSINRGSQDITLAIARSLTVPIKQAEQMKRDVNKSTSQDKAVPELVNITSSYILTEISRIALNFERKYNSVIHKLVLTGGGVLLNDFINEAEKTLQMEVVLGNPFASVEAPAFLEPILRSAGPEFAVAIGLALRKLEEIS
jgi:type IV pilus assembly protein PilM